MDAIEVLTQRVSVPSLTGPDITEAQKNIMIQAALRAPDHARLRPSRYLMVYGSALERLGDVFASTEAESGDDARLNRLKGMPLRAPLIIVAICKTTSHPKVPEVEQILSTGAGVQNILNAAWAMGLGAIWRTGDLAYHERVRQALGVQGDEQLLGFIYVGHIGGFVKAVPDVTVGDYSQDW